MLGSERSRLVLTGRFGPRHRSGSRNPTENHLTHRQTLEETCLGGVFESFSSNFDAPLVSGLTPSPPPSRHNGRKFLLRASPARQDVPLRTSHARPESRFHWLLLVVPWLILDGDSIVPGWSEPLQSRVAITTPKLRPLPGDRFLFAPLIG